MGCWGVGAGCSFWGGRRGWADPGVCAVQVQEEAASAPTVGMVLGESFCLGHGDLQPQTPCGVLLLSLCFLRQDKATPRTTFSLLQYPISTDFGRKRMGFFFFRHHLALKNFQHLFCLFFSLSFMENFDRFLLFFFFFCLPLGSQAKLQAF